MNAVLLAVVLMLGLSLARVNVVISLIVASVVGGLAGGWTWRPPSVSFNAGIGGGAGVALSYALLGAFALALAQSACRMRWPTGCWRWCNADRAHCSSGPCSAH